MARRKAWAVAYYRSGGSDDERDAANARAHQARACELWASENRLEIVNEFEDPVADWEDPLDGREGFTALLAAAQDNGASHVLVETASCFSTDMAVQFTGRELLRARGLELVPVDDPNYFLRSAKTAKIVREILGTVSEFERAEQDAKQRAAEERKRPSRRGRRPVPSEVVAEAQRLAKRNPRTGERRSLRAIAAELEALGYVGTSGGQYHPGSVKRMLSR